jgi:hypothetical protein
MSVDSNELTNVEVPNETDKSTSEVIQTNTNQNPNTSTSAKVDDKTKVPPGIFVYTKASYPLSKVKNIVKTLTIGDHGDIEVQSKLGENVYGITLLTLDAQSEYEKLVLQLPPVCSRVYKNLHPR